MLGLDSNLAPVWINQSGSGDGLTNTQKQAILNCFERAAWADPDGANYYDELQSLFFPAVTIESISATYQNSNPVYPTTPIDNLRPYITVTALYSDTSTKEVKAYTISGVLVVGSNVLTISYSGKTATINVTAINQGKSDMDEWADGVTYTDLEVVQDSYYTGAGDISNYNGWNRTGKVYCHGASSLTFVRAEASASSSQNYSVFFGEDKTTKVGDRFEFMPANQSTETVSVPEEAYYFGISAPRARMDEVINGITPHA